MDMPSSLCVIGPVEMARAVAHFHDECYDGNSVELYQYRKALLSLIRKDFQDEACEGSSH